MIYRTKFKQKRNWQQGFTLIEVMVALLVIAVGMLGIAALYIESMRSSQLSVSYTNAVMLAGSMADKIRGNTAGLENYVGNVNGEAQAGSNASNCVNGNFDCTPAQLALDDWFWWYEDVKNQLPVDRAATIRVLNNPPVNVYTITLTWPERGFATPNSYTLRFSQ